MVPTNVPGICSSSILKVTWSSTALSCRSNTPGPCPWANVNKNCNRMDTVRWKNVLGGALLCLLLLVLICSMAIATAFFREVSNRVLPCDHAYQITFLRYLAQQHTLCSLLDMSNRSDTGHRDGEILGVVSQGGFPPHWTAGCFATRSTGDLVLSGVVVKLRPASRRTSADNSQIPARFSAKLTRSVPWYIHFPSCKFAFSIFSSKWYKTLVSMETPHQPHLAVPLYLCTMLLPVGDVTSSALYPMIDTGCCNPFWARVSHEKGRVGLCGFILGM